MTAEQEKRVAEISTRNEYRDAIYNGGEVVRDVRALLSIIDDLQKQQQERYTEAELRAACAVGFKMNENPSAVEIAFFESSVNDWLNCARFLGMIKTEVEL